MAELTVLLRAAQGQDPDAVKRLFEIVYGDLKRLAHSNLRKSSGVDELNTTALVLSSPCRRSNFRTPWRDFPRLASLRVRAEILIGLVGGKFPAVNVNIRQSPPLVFPTGATCAAPILIVSPR